MTNSTNTDQNTNSLDKQKANTLWKILEPYKDKYLQVWWYGGMEKGKKPGDQPQVHVLFREVLEDFSPTNNFFRLQLILQILFRGELIPFGISKERLRA